MGSSNSVCINIHLDRINPLFFDGELVSGRVNVSIKERAIKVDEVFILLNGETGYTTARTVHESTGSSRTQTDYHTVTFLKIKKRLSTPGSGQKELVYHPGNYSWRFEIPLPHQLPPSLNQPHVYPRVRYYLRLVIDKSWYKRNKSETLYLTIFPRVNLMHNPQWLTSTIFSNHNRKDVTLKGHLDKIGYLPGETITGLIEIDNPRQISIKKIQVKLTQYCRIESNTIDEIIFDKFLSTIDQGNQEQIKGNFSIILPFISLAPSYDFHGGYDHIARVNINYSLEFEVKVEGVFTNFKVSLPITIGTESGTSNSNQYEQNQTANVLPNSVLYYPEMNDEDMTNPPPSYSSLYA